jgi:hypothetical protein
MGKRGPKPRRLISEKWSPELAYAIGLLATDGCLAKTSAQIDLTSKDREQLRNFCACVGVDLPITKKRGGNGKTYLRVQFKSVLFYDFLLSVGLTPAKSKTLGSLNIPDTYFFHFLRGSFDGDGSSYSYLDPRWPTSFLFYISFNSASEAHIRWLRDTLQRLLGVHGHVSRMHMRSLRSLRYGKKEGLTIAKAMYRGSPICLSRKRLKIEAAFAMMGRHL